MTKKILEWEEIELVLLDLDGTLLDLNFDNWFWNYYLPIEYAKTFSIPNHQAIDFTRKSLDSKSGTLSWYDIDYWSERFMIDIAKIKLRSSSKVSLRPNVIEFLSSMRRANKELVMVTNAHRKVFEIKMEKIDLTGWFDKIIISHELKAAKEDILFWEKLEPLLKIDFHKALLIDDNEEVLKVAKNFGVGQVLSIANPDSGQKPKRKSSYHAISDFSEIIPF